eukprot:145372-Prymnesium_polylepis.1
MGAVGEARRGDVSGRGGQVVGVRSRGGRLAEVRRACSHKRPAGLPPRARLPHEGGRGRVPKGLLELGSALAEAEVDRGAIGAEEVLQIEAVLRRLLGVGHGDPRHERPAATAHRRTDREACRARAAPGRVRSRAGGERAREHTMGAAEGGGEGRGGKGRHVER